MRNTYLQFGTKNVAADLDSGGRTLLAFCNFIKKLSQTQFLQLVLRMFPTSSYVIWSSSEKWAQGCFTYVISSFLKMTLLPTISIREMVFANEIMPYFFAPYANIYRKMHCAAHQKEFREKLLFPLHRRQQRHRFAILLLLFNSKEKRLPAVLPF